MIFRRALCTLLAVTTLSWPVRAEVPAEWRAWKLPGAEPLPAGARLRLGSGGVLMPLTGGAALSQDAKYLAVLSSRNIQLIARESGQELALIPTPEGFASLTSVVSFSPGNNYLVFGDSKRLTVAAVPSGKLLREIAVPDYGLSIGMSASFSADGKWITLGNGQPSAGAYVFELATGKACGPFKVLPFFLGLKSALSGDGKILATYGSPRPNLGAPAPPVLQLWDVATTEELRRVAIKGGQGIPSCLAFAPNGKTLAVGVEVFDVRFLADGTLDRNFAPRYEIELLDTATGQEQRRLTGQSDPFALLTYSADGEYLVAVGKMGRVRTWHLKNDKRRYYSAGPLIEPFAIAFSGPEQFIVLGSHGDTLLWWDAATGKTLPPHRGHFSSPMAAVFASTGKSLTVASKDGQVITWDALTGAILRQSDLAEDTVGPGRVPTRFHQVALSPDGRLSAISIRTAEGASIRVRDLRDDKLLFDFEAKGLKLSTHMAFSGKGERLAAVTESGSVVGWDIDTGDFLTPADRSEKRPYSGITNLLAFTPDGTRFALVHRNFDRDTMKLNSRASVFTLRTGKQLFVLPEAPDAGFFSTPTFSPDNKSLAVIVNFSTKSEKVGFVQLIDAKTGVETQRLKKRRKRGNATALAFAPDGRTLAVALLPRGPLETLRESGAAPTIEVWDLASGTLRHEFTGHSSVINTLVFSPDGGTLASGSWDTTLLLWDTSGLAK